MGSRRSGRPDPLLTGLWLGLLLLSGRKSLAQATFLSALARHPHLCQTSWDAQGRRYPGFFCPRLSDPPEEAYCCRLQAAGGFCCAREEFEALHQVNLSALPPPPILRGTGPLLALGLYSLLLVALLTADLVHFCRGRGPRRGRRAPAPRSSAARPLRVNAGTYY